MQERKGNLFTVSAAGREFGVREIEGGGVRVCVVCCVFFPSVHQFFFRTSSFPTWDLPKSQVVN